MSILDAMDKLNEHFELPAYKDVQKEDKPKINKCCKDKEMIIEALKARIEELKGTIDVLHEEITSAREQIAHLNEINDDLKHENSMLLR